MSHPQVVAEVRSQLERDSAVPHLHCNAGTTYDDLERTGRGRYRLIT